MLATILALALAVHPASPAAESSRPLVDSQWLRTIVPRADGFDVYWFRHNEVRPPLGSRMFRTALDLDGRIAGPTAIIASPATRALSSGPGRPLLYWSTDDRSLYAAPLSAGGDGVLIATGAEYPSIHCEQSSCFARWVALQGGSRGAFLDLSGNIVNGPFPLPGVLYDILPVSIDAEGAALVSASLNEYAVVRIARDGTVRANVPFLGHATYTTTAVSHDGERAVVAYIPKPWPDEPSSLAVSALAIAPDGTIANLGSLFAPAGAIHLTGLAMGWNGTSHLLVGGYVDQAYKSQIFAVELDRQLHVVAATQIPAEFPYGVRFEVVPNGDRFAIGWTNHKPLVAIYRGGTLSAPVALEDGPARRRMIRH
ncbi:MAG TPA: hypothetical protein VF432_02625 [Thermoanaerobaculia bacterium]